MKLHCVKWILAILASAGIIIFINFADFSMKLTADQGRVVLPTVNPVLPFPYNSSHPVLLSNNRICSEAKNLSLIVLVHSAPTHFQHRNAIRNSYANYSNYPPHINFRVVFLFGKVKTQELQEKLDAEHKAHGDIVQGNFQDGYHAGVLITLHGLKWVDDHCRNAKLVMKADDDIVMDMHTIFLRITPKFINTTNHIFCMQRRNDPIHREKDSKFFIPESVLKGDYFPTYCEGKLVMFTPDLVPQMINNAKFPQEVWLEDVYMYGFVLNRVPDVVVDTYRWGVDFDVSCGDSTKCVTTDKQCKKIGVELSGDIAPKIQDIWNVFHSRHKTCQIRPRDNTVYICLFVAILVFVVLFFANLYHADRLIMSVCTARFCKNVP